MADFYKKILNLKKTNPALFNGNYGGSWERINTGDNEKVFALIRSKDEHKVISVVNLGPEPATVKLNNDAIKGSYTELFSGENAALESENSIELPAWGYKVYFK